MIILAVLGLLVVVPLVSRSFTRHVYRHQERMAKLNYKHRIKMEKFNRKFPKQ